MLRSRVYLRPVSILLLLLVLITPASVAARSAEATPEAPEIVTPPSAITTYAIDVTLDSETNRLSGSESIVWVNTTGQSQTALYLRLYPNARYYGDAATSVSHATVDGRATTTSSAADPTVLTVPLGESVAPGKKATVDIDFTTVVPVASNGSFGIFQHDATNGAWTLADWYPILAGWEPERDAWYLDPPTSFGDPTFSDIATYTVTVTAPATYAITSTGDVSGTTRTGDAAVTRTVTTGPVRDFAMTFLPTSDSPAGKVVQEERTVDGVTPGRPFTIRISLFQADAIPGIEDTILDVAAKALPAYAGLLAELPEDELDITTASLSGANGVSWSGSIWLDLSTIVRDGKLSDQEKTGLTFVVTHEVGHQWIGAMIGNDSNDHGFMTEGLTNALALDVLRETEGSTAAVSYMQRYIAGGYVALLRDGRDVVADAPITDDTNGVLRSLAVYGKAAIGFEAIRQELGDDAFRSAMRSYARHFAYGNATPDDLRSLYIAAAPRGADVATLWTFWFEAQTAKVADADRIVAHSGD